MDRLEYRVIVEPLSADDGGGYLAYVPDLPGCMTDGDTPAEAIARIEDAIREWKAAARMLGREIPRPRKNLAHV